MLKIIPILLVFLVMGVADAMGPLSNAVETNFKISPLTATLLSSCVFIAFAVFSVPGGVLAGRIGKKNLLLLGLALNAGAMFVPTVMEPGFPLLLACIFVLGVGTTLLQVAGNPIVRDVSPEGAYSRNLALAQGTKGVGSSAMSFLALAGISLTTLFSGGAPTKVDSTEETAAAVEQAVEGDVQTGDVAADATADAPESEGDWRSAFPIYFGLMMIALVSVALVPVTETPSDTPPSIGSSLALLGTPIFFMAVLGIFLYVGAEVCMARFIPTALADLGMAKEEVAWKGATLFFAVLAACRLLASAALKVMTPLACFRGSALLGLVGSLLFMFATSQTMALAGVVCAGVGFANIWPMLFSLTVEHRPERANELSGLMCMAISGGALVPLAMGKLYDLEWGPKSFIVPAACFAYLMLLSMRPGPSRSATAAA